MKGCLAIRRNLKMIINKCTVPQPDIACQDGVCPDCNYYKYQLWLSDHGHCDQASWECPDEEDCPYKNGHIEPVTNLLGVHLKGNNNDLPR